MSCSSCGNAGANAQKNTTANQPCNANKQPSATRILNNVNLWPKDFQRPTTISNICVKTYVFKNYPTLFIAYVQKNLPNVPVKIDQDNNGYTMVTITGLGTNGTLRTNEVPQTENDLEIPYNPNEAKGDISDIEDNESTLEYDYDNEDSILDSVEDEEGEEEGVGG